MNFLETGSPGLLIIEPTLQQDERGFFARTYSAREFAACGLPTEWPEWNISYNRRSATLRGLHYQRAPHGEPKLVSCTRGRVFDVVLDLRPGSATHMGWFAFELSAENRRTLYVPAGFAHGFQTLEDDTELVYHMGALYHPPAAAGVRWNDPAFGIAWPLPNPIVSPRDAAFPDYGA